MPPRGLKSLQSAPRGGGSSSGSEPEMTKNFYTPSEIAQILDVPHRRILEQLAAGEIEAELDPRTGRWKIPKSTLNGTETTGLTEAEAAWQDEKALLLAELHRKRALESSSGRRDCAAGLGSLKPSVPRGYAGGYSEGKKSKDITNSYYVRSSISFTQGDTKLQRSKGRFSATMGQEPEIELFLS